MNTQALKTVRRLFNVDYVPKEQNRHNQRAWVRSVRILGGSLVIVSAGGEKTMKPTQKLRFVDRNEPVILNGERFDNWRKVLQQWWTNDFIEPVEGEWRDVPLEKEE